MESAQASQNLAGMPNSPIVLETNLSNHWSDTNPQSIVRNSDSYSVDKIEWVQKMKANKALLIY